MRGEDDGSVDGHKPGVGDVRVNTVNGQEARESASSNVKDTAVFGEEIIAQQEWRMELGDVEGVGDLGAVTQLELKRSGALAGEAIAAGRAERRSRSVERWTPMVRDQRPGVGVEDGDVGAGVDDGLDWNAFDVDVKVEAVVRRSAVVESVGSEVAWYWRVTPHTS